MKPLTQHPVANIDLFGNDREHERAPLAGRFTVSPFSVFDVKVADWAKRKREWIKTLQIRGEEGRDSMAELSGDRCFAAGGQDRLDNFRAKINVNNICSEKWGRGQGVEVVPGGGGPGAVRRRGASQLGKCFQSGEAGELNKHLKRGDTTGAEGQHGTLGISDSAMRIVGGYHEGGGKAKSTAGTSIFDPVLCEIGYRWFAPAGGRILDPFAGGSTRGLVAAYCGYQYVGIELRAAQIEANQQQAAQLKETLKKWHPDDEWLAPEWVEGDSSNLENLLVLEDDFDLIFTCPPYYNLEVYSTDAGDGSAFPNYPAFMEWYRNIFRQAVAKLKQDRFVFITVGDVRDNKSALGEYLNFEADTIACFRDLGLYPYNRAALVTAIGSLPVRIGDQFPKYRKLGNTHQMCYMFWKGTRDKQAIKESLGVLAAESFKEQ